LIDAIIQRFIPQSVLAPLPADVETKW
jgi:hypothetical protein